jgi:hydroxymethylglutaryl-CoA lyase|tara:strand:- start:940 stop:1776 length:837 start_codon:yes stop_codon:yes gene_type:complete
MKVTVYEVGPRDGLQNIKEFIPTETKIDLINALYSAGLEHIEETSFAHPKYVPQMADAEKVYQKGAVLVMNQRGLERALSVGAKKINIVYSPCDTFNLNSFGKTRSELMLMYYTMLSKIPKEDVRVYISMAFGSPYSGEVSPMIMRLCLRDAKMFGNTVVFADTVGCGTDNEVALWAEMAIDEGLKPALHLHHDDESKVMRLVKAGLLNGIKEFDSSIGGLGGCPFVDNASGNLATETLVRHLNVWGFDCGVKEEDLKEASNIAEKVIMLTKRIKLVV